MSFTNIIDKNIQFNNYIEMFTLVNCMYHFTYYYFIPFPFFHEFGCSKISISSFGNFSGNVYYFLKRFILMLCQDLISNSIEFFFIWKSSFLKLDRHMFVTARQLRWRQSTKIRSGNKFRVTTGFSIFKYFGWLKYSYLKCFWIGCTSSNSYAM